MNATVTILEREVIKDGAPPQKHGQQKNGKFGWTQQVSRKTHWRVARRPYSKIYGGNNTSIDHLTAHNKTILLYLLHEAAIFVVGSHGFTQIECAQHKIKSGRKIYGNYQREKSYIVMWWFFIILAKFQQYWKYFNTISSRLERSASTFYWLTKELKAFSALFKPDIKCCSTITSLVFLSPKLFISTCTHKTILVQAFVLHVWNELDDFPSTEFKLSKLS